VDLRQIGQATISVVDPSGGERDLEDGVVRAVSEKALQEDPLRLLRAVRLVAELDFSLDAETRAMIGRNHVLLGGVSAERVRDELCRMLAVPGAAEWLRLLDQVGLLTVVVPELAATKGVGQPKEHVWDVFEHSLQTVAAVELVLQMDSAAVWDREVASVVPWSAEMKDYFEEEVSVGRSRGTMLKLAGLLHDVAKPQTKFVDSDGRTRFFGHAKEGAVIATQVLKRLRFSTREVGMVSSMVRHHLRPTQLGGVTPSRRAIYRYFKDTGEAAIDTLFLSLADHLATRGPLVDLDAFREHADSVAYVLEEPAREQSVVTPPKLVNGNDLMAIYGIAPGPRLGEILEAVREAQAAGEVMTREDALSFVERYLGRATVDIRQDARRKNE
ncbi:MAG: HD domain-containing protein, partial [Chloroflexota bacterium]